MALWLQTREPLTGTGGDGESGRSWQGRGGHGDLYILEPGMALKTQSAHDARKKRKQIKCMCHTLEGETPRGVKLT